MFPFLIFWFNLPKYDPWIEVTVSEDCLLRCNEVVESDLKTKRIKGEDRVKHYQLHCLWVNVVNKEKRNFLKYLKETLHL